MIIVWQRLGFLGLVVPAVSVAVCRSLFPAAESAGSAGVGGLTTPATGWGLIVGGLLLWPLGVWLNCPERRTEFDHVTGQPVVVEYPGHHKLYWLRVQHWAYVWAALGVYCLIRG